MIISNTKAVNFNGSTIITILGTITRNMWCFDYGLETND